MLDITSFWKWAFSDLLSNSLRGALAEYMVSIALGCTERPRVEWDAYDLKRSDGTKIEVKSSAYLQAWKQKKLSVITFDIAMKKAWDSESDQVQVKAMRSADLYIFSVFATLDRSTANPLDVHQWFFLVTSSAFLNQFFGHQRSVRLSSLEKKGLKRCSFDELKSECDQLIYYAKTFD